MRHAWIATLTLVALAVLPEVVQACPVCFDANDENRQAFFVTTATVPYSAARSANESPATPDPMTR